MTRALILILGLCLTVGSASRVDAEETYEIRLHRPPKAGDKFKVAVKLSIDSESVTTETRKGEKPEVKRKESLKASCKVAGELEVRGITRNGFPKSLRLKVEEAECSVDGLTDDALKRGDIVEMSYSEPRPAVTINEEEPDRIQLQILDALFAVRSDEAANLDEIFGTKEKQKPGGTWQFKPELAAKDLESFGLIGLDPKGVSGSMTFVEVGTLGGEPALVLKGKLKVEAEGFQIRGWPQAFKANAYSMESESETHIPVDANSKDDLTRGEVRSSLEMIGTVEIDGKQVEVSVKSKHHTNVERASSQIK